MEASVALGGMGGREEGGGERGREGEGREGGEGEGKGRHLNGDH